MQLVSGRRSSRRVLPRPGSDAHDYHHHDPVNHNQHHNDHYNDNDDDAGQLPVDRGAVGLRRTTAAPSAYDERPQPRGDFQNEEALTETLASMSSSDLQEFGYSLHDLVLDCKFSGSNCDPS